MRERVDVFWSFRSPYSYLATPELLKLRDDYDIDVKLRPVLPIAVRSKDTLFTSDPRKVRYIIIDAMRRAQYLGMKMSFPSPDPIVQDMQTFEVSDEQPYIYRLTALGVEAAKRGKGIDLAYHVSHLIWGDSPGWDEGERLATAVSKAGLDLADLEAAIATYDPLEIITANQEALDASGHWGVPTLVFKGEPFFGQDRIDTLCWRLETSGVTKRAS